MAQVAAVAWVLYLAWELLHAMGAAQGKKKTNQKQTKTLWSSKWIILITKEKMTPIVEKYDRPHLSPMVYVNITVMNKLTRVPLDEKHQEGYHLCGLPAERTEPEPNHEKTIDTLKLGTVYNITGLIL